MKVVALAAIGLLIAGCASRSELEAAQQAASQAEARGATLEADVADVQDQLRNSGATATALSEQNVQLQADLAQARKDYQDASRQVDRLSDEVGGFLCDGQISDMKYDNVLDASTILSAWFARQPDVEAVHTPYRDKIWSNALSQLHGITYTSSEDHQQYVEHFMVYFDEFGMDPAVFWIGGQCWLDAP